MVAIAVVMFIPNIISLFGVDDSENIVTDPPTMLIYSEDESLASLVKEYFTEAFVGYSVRIAEGGFDDLKEQIANGEAECAFVMDSASAYTYYVNNYSMYDTNTEVADTVLQEVL